MKYYRLPSLILLSLFLTSIGNAQSLPIEGLEEEVDRVLAFFDRDRSPGAAIGIVKDGELVLAKGYGMANLEHRQKITPETIFDIASVSKQFGAFAIAMLVDQEVVSLDDPVHQYIPELPDFGSPITIRHLVHHTSGVRDWPGNLALGGWRMDDVISFDQILRMAYHQRDLNFTPGAEYLYSNTGYNLLAETVARVTGQSFRSWMEENVFEPLDMQDTHFQDNHTEMVPNKAYGYVFQDGAHNSVANGLTALGSSSLFTTVNDLAKWVANFETASVGGEAVMALMHQQGMLNDGEQIAYAFGNSVTQYKGIERVAHSGSWAGFRTYLARFPEHGLGIILLTNLGHANPTSQTLQIADYILANHLEEPEESEEPPAMDSESDEVTVDLALLEQYAGVYAIPSGPMVTFEVEEGVLFTEIEGQPRFSLMPLSDTRFKVNVVGVDAEVHFESTDEGVNAEIHQNGVTQLRRMEEWEADLQEYVGRYFSPELETYYTIKDVDGMLEAHHLRNDPIQLMAQSQDVFAGNVWYFGEAEFIREDDVVTGMLVSSGRVRNVRFEKQVVQ